MGRQLVRLESQGRRSRGKSKTGSMDVLKRDNDRFWTMFCELLVWCVVHEWSTKAGSGPGAQILLNMTLDTMVIKTSTGYSVSVLCHLDLIISQQTNTSRWHGYLNHHTMCNFTLDPQQLGFCKSSSSLVSKWKHVFQLER